MHTVSAESVIRQLFNMFAVKAFCSYNVSDVLFAYLHVAQKNKLVAFN